MSHRPRRRYGQHFLHDPVIIGKILAAVDPSPGERVVEIGPGQGAITLPLLARAGRVDVVEIDRDLAAALRVVARSAAGELAVHEADALTFDFGTLADGGPLRGVGNLPYNISTPLLFHLLGHASRIRDMHFMLQKEVVTRMAAGPGGKEYGRLTVMLACLCRVEPLFDIGPGAFRPPPRVRSAFVRLTPWERPPFAMGPPETLAAVVRQAFSMRRKTLRNALAPLLTAEAISAAGCDPGARPETLSPADFGRLSLALAGD